MTETLNEQLSCFLDGELPEAETTLLLKRLDRDEELKGTLSRYSLIGSVLRADGDLSAAHHVAARVSAAIQVEPALGPRSGLRWIQPLAGLAVAASVAAATVVLLPLWSGGAVVTGSEALVANVPAAVTALEPEGEIVPVSVAEVVADDPGYTTPPAPLGAPSSLPPAQLASYLVAHSVYTSPLAARSMVTSVVVDAREPEAPPAAAQAPVEPSREDASR